MKLTIIFSVILSWCRFSDQALLFSGCTAMVLVFQASYSQISCDFFSPHPPTQNQETCIFDTKRTKRGWPQLSLIVSSCFVLFFSFGRWNKLKLTMFQDPLYSLWRFSSAHKKKWKGRGFIDRNGTGVGLGLVTALRFTRALSNGPEKQKEKRGQTIHV